MKKALDPAVLERQAAVALPDRELMKRLRRRGPKVVGSGNTDNSVTDNSTNISPSCGGGDANGTQSSQGPITNSCNVTR